MPDNRNLAIAHGIAQGFEKAATNIYNIGQAKQKLKRDEEAFALDKKVKNAQLKKMEFEFGPEKMAHEKEMMKLKETAQKTEIEAKKLTIAKEGTIQEGRLDFLKTKKQQYDTYLAGFDEGRAGQIADMSGRGEPMSRFDYMQETTPGLELDFDVGVGKIKRGAAKQPTWKQGQEVEAIKQGISQGVIPIKTEWGGSELLRPKTKDEAMEGLVRGGHNPYLYEAELDTKFGSAEVSDLPEGVTEEEMAHTMKLHNLSREEVLSRLK